MEQQTDGKPYHNRTVLSVIVSSGLILR